jgi:hypothetical protein
MSDRIKNKKEEIIKLLTSLNDVFLSKKEEEKKRNQEKSKEINEIKNELNEAIETVEKLIKK